MIGLVLVTHGRLADELRAAMEHVVGPQRNVATVCIGADDDMESRRGDILAAIGCVDTGDGVVLVTDMFGGTPSNLAISMMNGRKLEVLAGVNLPMLVKLAKCRGSQTLGECVEHATAAGRKYIASASEVLAQCAASECAMSKGDLARGDLTRMGVRKPEVPTPDRPEGLPKTGTCG